MTTVVSRHLNEISKVRDCLVIGSRLELRSLTKKLDRICMFIESKVSNVTDRLCCWKYHRPSVWFVFTSPSYIRSTRCIALSLTTPAQCVRVGLSTVTSKLMFVCIIDSGLHQLKTGCVHGCYITPQQGGGNAHVSIDWLASVSHRRLPDTASYSVCFVTAIIDSSCFLHRCSLMSLSGR